MIEYECTKLTYHMTNKLMFKLHELLENKHKHEKAIEHIDSPYIPTRV